MSGSRGLVVPVVCAVVLLVGVVVAVGGRLAVRSSEDRAASVTEELALGRTARDRAQREAAEATAEAADATAELADATADAERVRDAATDAAAATDDFRDCAGRLVAATAELIAAVEAEDDERAGRALDDFNAAADECNAAIDAYDAALTELFGGTSGGVVTA